MTDQQWDLKILCMGAGYVGGPTMAVIAKQCPKVRFFVAAERLDLDYIYQKRSAIPSRDNNEAP